MLLCKVGPRAPAPAALWRARAPTAGHGAVHVTPAERSWQPATFQAVAAGERAALCRQPPGEFARAPRRRATAPPLLLAGPGVGQRAGRAGGRGRVRVRCGAERARARAPGDDEGCGGGAGHHRIQGGPEACRRARRPNPTHPTPAAVLASRSLLALRGIRGGPAACRRARRRAGPCTLSWLRCSETGLNCAGAPAAPQPAAATQPWAAARLGCRLCPRLLSCCLGPRTASSTRSESVSGAATAAVLWGA